MHYISSGRSSKMVLHPSPGSPASASAASPTASFAQWHRRLGHLSGSRLSSLVGSGVLGSVSGDTALNCLGYKLGKQLQLPYPSSESCPRDLLILFILMYGVLHL